MFKLLCPIPRSVYVAVSGGVDSMAALNFLARSHDVAAVFFDHGDSHALGTLDFIKDYCRKIDVKVLDGALMRSKKNEESLEEYWRSERYRFFDHVCEQEQRLVVTAHHLDDAVETWVWSALNGSPKLPSIWRGQILRPFLATPKRDLVDWAVRHNVPWMEDPTNGDSRRTRNIIRTEGMDFIHKVNPGIDTMIRKKLLEIAKNASESVDSNSSDAIVST